jgi:hypothetical protein
MPSREPPAGARRQPDALLALAKNIWRCLERAERTHWVLLEPVRESRLQQQAANALKCPFDLLLPWVSLLVPVSPAADNGQDARAALPNPARRQSRTLRQVFRCRPPGTDWVRFDRTDALAPDHPNDRAKALSADGRPGPPLEASQGALAPSAAATWSLPPRVPRFAADRRHRHSQAARIAPFFPRQRIRSGRGLKLHSAILVGRSDHSLHRHRSAAPPGALNLRHLQERERHCRRFGKANGFDPDQG